MFLLIRNTFHDRHLEKSETVSHFSRVQRFEESEARPKEVMLRSEIAMKNRLTFNREPDERQEFHSGRTNNG
jgi:hypothetical protein